MAISILGFGIRWYALAYIFGFIFAYFLANRTIKRSENPIMSSKQLEDLIFWVMLGVVLGGRFGYVLFYQFSLYISDPLAIFRLWEGGMSFHGGMFGAVFSAYLFSRKFGIAFLGIADLMAITAPIGIFLGRIANFVNGELFGRVTDSSFGVIFPDGGELPRHPSQLYEAFSEGLLILIIMQIAIRYGILRNHGYAACLFLFLYGIFRIICEFFREPDIQLGFLMFGLTMGQLLSVPLVMLGIYLFMRIKNGKR